MHSIAHANWREDARTLRTCKWAHLKMETIKLKTHMCVCIQIKHMHNTYIHIWIKKKTNTKLAIHNGSFNLILSEQNSFTIQTTFYPMCRIFSYADLRPLLVYNIYYISNQIQVKLKKNRKKIIIFVHAICQILTIALIYIIMEKRFTTKNMSFNIVFKPHILKEKLIIIIISYYIFNRRRDDAASPDQKERKVGAGERLADPQFGLFVFFFCVSSYH